MVIPLLLLLAGAPVPQDTLNDEVVVTGSRTALFANNGNNIQVAIPAVGLRKVADFAVQEVVITGDTRDPDKRKAEIYEMVQKTIELAARRGGIELATGEMVVEPLTSANYRNLPLLPDRRPDTNRVSFLIKAKLAGAGDPKAVLDRIKAFIKDVPPVGRALLEPDGGLTLSLVGPDQYRAQVLDLVAADARATAAKLGPDYSVELRGADRPVEWSRASQTEVFLFVPYSYTVMARR